MEIKNGKSALLLIGYQNDYFAKNGVLRSVIEESVTERNILEASMKLIERALSEGIQVIATPIVFCDDYRELDNPLGILKTCKDLGAFRRSSIGSQAIKEFKAYGDAILELPGKTGLNAFSNTSLLETLRSEGVEELLIAGVVTSVCIDSTARYAADQGFRVTIVSDCSAGRSTFEHEYYCSDIFPIFARVQTTEEIFSSEVVAAAIR